MDYIIGQEYATGTALFEERKFADAITEELCFKAVDAPIGPARGVIFLGAGFYGAGPGDEADLAGGNQFARR